MNTHSGWACVITAAVCYGALFSIAATTSPATSPATQAAASGPSSQPTDANSGSPVKLLDAKTLFDLGKTIIFEDDFRSGIGKWAIAIDDR